MPACGCGTMPCCRILELLYAQGAMQRRTVRMLSALRALLAPAAQRDAADRSASPLLIYVAAALFLMLSILMIDQHRGELRALGFVGGTERINPVFMSP